MKTIIRTLVIALTFTGVLASATTSSSSAAQISVVKINAFPTPMCPLDDPNACGMGK